MYRLMISAAEFYGSPPRNMTWASYDTYEEAIAAGTDMVRGGSRDIYKVWIEREGSRARVWCHEMRASF